MGPGGAGGRRPALHRGVRRCRPPGCSGPPRGVPPVALKAHGSFVPVIQLRLPRGHHPTGGDLRRCHGHQPAAGRADGGRLRGPGPRGLQRDAGTDAARRHRPGPPVVPRGRVRRGGDRHLRGLRPGAGRVRPGPPGARAQPGRCRPGQGGGRRLLHSRPSPMGGRQHRPGHQVPHTRPDQVRRPPRRLRGAGLGSDRGERGPDRHRDGLRPPAGQGGHQRGPPGHAGGRAPSAHPDPGDHRTDRHHAPRHRDRRRPLRPRGHGCRSHRTQLRHRPERDVRAAAPPVGPLDASR